MSLPLSTFDMPDIRYDGRRDTELRPLDAQLGLLDRADGSAKFGFGEIAHLLFQ